MEVGCTLNHEKINIIAFADDVFLLSPSLKGLQAMTDKILRCFNNIKLSVNVDKSKYIIFKRKKNMKYSNTLKLDNIQIERVSNLKYLGVFLNENFDLAPECDRVLRKFLIQFNCLYQKFNFLPTNILSYLFKTYCTSFYGINTWFGGSARVSDMNKVEVAYHKAVKKVARMDIWQSNHEACEKIGVNVFKHLLSRRLLRFYANVVNSSCKLIRRMNLYLMLNSKLYGTISNRMSNMYGIINFIGNDKAALNARIFFVERNEPRSTYVYQPDESS